IQRQGAEYLLVDLDSGTGIYHNGHRVTNVVMKADDVFSIGRHGFVFRPAGVFLLGDMRPAFLEADDVTVFGYLPLLFGRRRILDALLDDVSFVVRRGTMLGVVGPSGSGKSTLLRAVAGIVPVAQGRLLFDKQILDARSNRRRIGIVPQED